MGIKQEITGIRKLFGQGADLLLLRFRILRLDLEDQAAGVLKIAAIIAAAAILCLVAFIAALFGLNAVLTPEAKIWTFFGIAAAALLAVSVLLMRIAAIWKSGSAKVGQTLQDIQEDLQHLRGQAGADEGGRYDRQE